jgi:hypothetical protein
MPEPRYPTLEEFWKRLEVRETEPDLREQLRTRTRREERGTPGLGPGRGAVAVAFARRLLPGDVPAEALAADPGTSCNGTVRGTAPAGGVGCSADAMSRPA